MIYEHVILVTDSNKKITNADISDRNLEGNTESTTFQIANAIKEVVQNFTLYTDTKFFLQNYDQCKKSVIFPMKYGENTSNSKSIIPAICEGGEMRYIGGDEYAHVLCNDKYNAKLFARQFGIHSAPCFLVRDFKHSSKVLNNIKGLTLPLVVKPNFGGGSTGISSGNICFSYEDAFALGKKLHMHHCMPILIEEYIAGEEVELIIVGNKHKIIFSEEVQLIMGNQEYFTEEIWGYETKKIDDSSIDFKIGNYIDTETKAKIHQLFKAFDKIEFMRVDGRISDGKFYLIELSPDCYLGDDCAFYYAFQSHNYSLSQMFEILIQNGLNHYLS